MSVFNNSLLVLLSLVVIFQGCNKGPGSGNASNGTAAELNQVDSSGLKQGPWKIYEDDVLVAQGTYLDGNPDGLWIYWYENGQKKEEGNYTKGVRTGMWVEWYRDGETMWKGEWENGKRKIFTLNETAENAVLTFTGRQPADHTLMRDSSYSLRIRIMNIPVSHLYVEAENGSITVGTEPDIYILKTSSDTVLTLAIGYIPDLEFPDFRNLVREIDYTVQ